MSAHTERPELPPLALEGRWEDPLPASVAHRIADAIGDAAASAAAVVRGAARGAEAFVGPAREALGPSPWQQPGSAPWLPSSSSPWEAAQAASWAGLAVLALLVSLRLLFGPGVAAPLPAHGPRRLAKRARARPGPETREGEEGGVSAPKRATEPG